MFSTPIYRDLNRSLRDVIGEKTATQFARLGVNTVDDLVRHVPRRYIAGSQMTSFDTLVPGEEVAVVAEVESTEVKFGARTRVETILGDGTKAKLRVTLFVPPKKDRIKDYWVGLLKLSLIHI